jgi:tetratricopeptide (TPR) repeat protein
MLFAALIPLVAQASAPPSFEEARRFVCLDQARTDPTAAILTASTWLRESTGAERLSRWQAAEEAFLLAHDLAPDTDHAFRAKLATMAGNAAIAQDQNLGALADFEIALADAEKAGDTRLAGDIQVDRARALVALERPGDAAEALVIARRDAPQNPETWLLSATMSRRLEQLEIAQSQIETAAGLDPRNPAIGLEAGVIAILSGREDAAVRSWRSVIEFAPDSPEAATARSYIAQLEDPAE